MAGATANAASTQPGGTGSAAQAGAMGSSGGTTTGTVACSSCCAPQGRYLIDLFGGYGETGLCPGAIDNSQPFNVYCTYVLSLNSPYTPSQFCLNSSFTLSGIAHDLYSVLHPTAAGCSVITPPATSNNISPRSNNRQTFIDYGAGITATHEFKNLCGCSYPEILLTTNASVIFTIVSCSPPVITYSGYVINDATGLSIGTTAVTVTF